MLLPDSFDNLADLLNDRYRRYACPQFIDGDPIKVPHRFTDREDIEISALFSATLAWGSRKSIVASATRLMELMGWSPYRFVTNFSPRDEKRLRGFVHRTFNDNDAIGFIRVLQSIYTEGKGLEGIFSEGYSHSGGVRGAIQAYRKTFIDHGLPARTLRHVPNVEKNAAAKRINMFLRWMVRSSAEGVDFGFWRSIPSADLLMPLDLHTGRVARRLGLLQRKQDDLRAVVELTNELKGFDPNDPVKYDYALFGLGMHEFVK